MLALKPAPTPLPDRLSAASTPLAAAFTGFYDKDSESVSATGRNAAVCGASAPSTMLPVLPGAFEGTKEAIPLKLELVRHNRLDPHHVQVAKCSGAVH